MVRSVTNNNRTYIFFIFDLAIRHTLLIVNVDHGPYTVIWAHLFVFLVQISTVGGTNQHHLAYMMLLCYVHYITLGHLYYKHAYSRVLEVCKQKQRLFC